MKKLFAAMLFSLILGLSMLYCDTTKSKDNNNALLFILLLPQECLSADELSCWKGFSSAACTGLLGTLVPAFYCQSHGYTNCIGATFGAESAYVCTK